MSEAHLDTLSLVSRLQESLCLHNPTSDGARTLIKIAGDSPSRFLGTTPHLQRTDVAIELGGSIEECPTVVYGAASTQHLVIRANVNLSPLVPMEICARKPIELEANTELRVRLSFHLTAEGSLPLSNEPNGL